MIPVSSCLFRSPWGSTPFPIIPWIFSHRDKFLVVDRHTAQVPVTGKEYASTMLRGRLRTPLLATKIMLTSDSVSVEFVLVKLLEPE
jgi:hypothetical protein